MIILPRQARDKPLGCYAGGPLLLFRDRLGKALKKEYRCLAAYPAGGLYVNAAATWQGDTVTGGCDEGCNA